MCSYFGVMRLRNTFVFFAPRGGLNVDVDLTSFDEILYMQIEKFTVIDLWISYLNKYSHYAWKKHSAKDFYNLYSNRQFIQLFTLFFWSVYTVRNIHNIQDFRKTNFQSFQWLDFVASQSVKPVSRHSVAVIGNERGICFIYEWVRTGEGKATVHANNGFTLVRISD